MLFNILILTPIFILSIILSLSSYSWMSIWVGLEINLISFIMFTSNKKLFWTESSMKYFLIQSMGSIILLFSISLNMLIYESWPNLFNYTIPLAMMLKSGMAPLHGWTPPTLSKMSFISIFLFMTMQKIVPLMICFCSWMEIIMTSIFFNVILGALGGLIQSSLIKMMIFSSINNTGWMMMALTSSVIMFLIYFVVYSLLITLIMLLLHNKQIKWITQLSMMSKKYKIMIYSFFFSLSGLPPFLGFSIKWMIMNMMFYFMPLYTIIFIVTSLMTMFFYLKSSLNTMFFSTLNNKMNSNSQNFKFTNKFILMINIMGIPLFFILT